MSLRQQAEQIWTAGVAAVESARLVQQVVRYDDQQLYINGEGFARSDLRRIVVVGAGKAGAGMAAGLEQAIDDPDLKHRMIGWINVPADCIRPLQHIHLHAARPAGINEPTEAGAFGSEQILKLVRSLTQGDLCLVLVSGGGSALLPAPIDRISLADKLAVTQLLMRSGATIEQLNTVRKRLSKIKGGGLLRAAPAGKMFALIISDVVNDPLDIIASGPTVCDRGTAEDALKILVQYGGPRHTKNVVPTSVWSALEAQVQSGDFRQPPRISCRNWIIGNNQTALDASAAKASELGFEVHNLGTNR